MTSIVTQFTPVGADELARDPLRPRLSLKADVAAVLLLVLLTLATQWPLVTDGTVVGVDTATFFYPMYSFLGEQLRSGNIPGWNPWHMSGAPFAGDPQSGWMYLPVMVFFTLLSLDMAVKVYLVFTALLCTLGMYALARVLGMRPIGAAAAAIAYGFTGFMYQRNACCVVYAGVGAWLPVLFVAAEMGLRSRGRLTVIAWLGVGGFVLSQLFAVWLGQGTYYALLAFGGYLLVRTVIAPPAHRWRLRDRFTALLTHGLGPLVIGLALGAAGLLPRIEYNRLSNLAGGYGGKAFEHWKVNWSLADWPATLLVPGPWYVGSAVLVLAVMAPVLARRTYSVPFWSVLTVVSVVLSNPRPGPLQSAVYTLLPGFSGIHLHHTERSMQLFYLGVALLVGASVCSLLAEARGRLAVVAGLMLASLTLLSASRTELALLMGGLSVIGGIMVFVAAVGPWRSAQAAGTGLLLIVLCNVFLGAWAEAAKGLAASADNPSGYESLHKEHLSAYYAPSGAAGFLRSRGTADQGRYLGYGLDVRSGGSLYRYQYKSRHAADLLVNNRGTILGLADIQGYNPVHLARYDDYVNALNGRTQEYRGLYVLREGIGSPLLDMLNARYVVTAADQQLMPDGDRGGTGSAVPVYKDDEVSVYERTTALPRAWIVHRATQVAPGAAMGAVTRKDFAPRSTVILEDSVPTLRHPSDRQTERADVEKYTPDYIALTTRTTAAGLLVLSEPYYPAWKAYVDGEPVPLYAANHVVRAVPLPEGSHRVELRFESEMLNAGLTTSALAYVALVCVWAMSLLRWLRWGFATAALSRI